MLPKKAPSRSSAATRTREQSAWIQEVNRNPHGEGLAYTMNRSYKIKDSIQHPLFGLGFVQRVSGNQLTVLFREGTKRLIQKPSELC